ncbi:MAG: molecular chaperone TorD family protein [Lamprobacter sp.]|uniref:TorD/DmsD family molecular chaperone n=1 Tax=Lamprobacter sp. TaxID=3100796 RepID=UPI002B25C0A7|nr:molecular chaperone TorD family protein [Lamprobacter sp.]MEA3641789.1 molecular chaperone TorD family protein [Lamprobacter sp.]
MTDDAMALAKTEFFLCLARAFTTPGDSGFLAALREDLPLDLDELGAQLGYPLQPALADYRAAITSIADAEQLMVLYSRLFLVPGDHHPSLNTGTYLDGALAGGSLTMLERCYARCGLERQSGFRDLSDHLSAQLELVAWLLTAEAQSGGGPAVSAEPAAGGEPAVSAERSQHVEPPMRAEQILSQFVVHWVGPFRAELETATGRFRLAANPYLHLARVLEAVVRHEVGEDLSAQTRDSGIDPEIARLRTQFAGRELGEEDLAIIRARLAADGLPSDHIAIPEESRDRTMGLATMTPPGPPSHRLKTGA